MYSFSYLESVCCSMSSSNSCFLTCIQISLEAGQVVWYSHLSQVTKTPGGTIVSSVQFSRSVVFNSLRPPWITACQASLSITNSRSSLKLQSIESVMPSSHLILYRPLFFLPPITPSIRVFSNESTLRMRWPKYWSFNFSIISSKRTPRTDLLQNGLVGSPCNPRASCLSKFPPLYTRGPQWRLPV